jgi:hypothetical protein
MAIAMTPPPMITDESVLTRWMTMEIGKINEGIVKERKSLSVPLAEDTPSSTTKRGEPYYFKKGGHHGSWKETSPRAARPAEAADPVLSDSRCSGQLPVHR